MFNKYGAANVTTNHIADRMGISAGNLYYHFQNKEKIIRDIFYDFVIGNNDRIIEKYQRTLQTGHLTDALVFLLKLFYTHRFIFLDITYIISRDHSNTHWQKTTYYFGRRLFSMFYTHLLDNKYITKIPRDDLELVFGNFWLNLITWTPFLEAELNQRDHARLYQKKVIQMLEIFRHHMLKKGLTHIIELKDAL